MAVKKSGEGHGSPFELLLTIAFTAVPAFDYRLFVGDHDWLLDLLVEAGKAGGFSMEVIEANVPTDFQEKATPIEVMNLIEFMNAYSEKKSWPSLLEMAVKPEADEPKAKRPYHRKTRKGPYLRPRSKRIVRSGGNVTAVRTAGRLTLSKPALIKKHGTALMALNTIQSKVDRAGGVRKLAKRLRVKASALYNLMTVLRKEAGVSGSSEPKKTRRTKKRKAGKKEFSIRKKGLRALATAVVNRKKSSRQTKLQQFIAAVGTEKQATALLNTTYKASGTQSKAAAAIVRIAGEKGLKGFKLTQRELCDWFRKLNIAPLHPGRGPARKRQSD